MITKIYITGPVGSGKSTLARAWSLAYALPCTELDQVVYTADQTTDSGNQKRSVEERDTLFYAAIAQDRWIVEDAGRAYFEEAMRRADAVVLLEPSGPVRRLRIVRRWLRQRTGKEACGYIPDFHMLRLMFKWSRSYERGIDTLRRRLAPYKTKLHVIKNERDLSMFINAYLR